MSIQSSLYTPLDIKGYVVLITGASSGFGEACAWRFAENNCKLILAARRIERLEDLKKKIVERFSVEIRTIQLDMQDLERVQKLPEKLPGEFSKVDILINNAGLALDSCPIHEVKMQDIRTMFETNVMAVFALTKTIIPGMISRQRGHIINVSSVAGHEAYVGGSGYCGSKFALDAMTTATRHDLVATPIRVTAISPGAAKTEFSIVRFGGDKERTDAVYQGFVPLNANDIADNIVYAATRPAHVQIADMIIFATAQSSARGIARETQI